MRKLVIALVGFVCALAAVTVAAPPASAGALQPLECSVFLRVDPPTPGARAYCPTRSGIYLAADKYRMRSALLNSNRSGYVGGSIGTRDITVPAGTYSWRCYVTQAPSQTYTTGCDLIYASGTVVPMGSTQFRIPTSGTYVIHGEFYSVA